jgi:hypothetical protein
MREPTTELIRRAISLGASDLKPSPNKGKRFYVILDGRKIHFGSKTGQTYIDQDKKKRKAWYARHSKILLKDGSKAIDNIKSPSFWSSRLTWPLDIN